MKYNGKGEKGKDKSQIWLEFQQSISKIQERLLQYDPVRDKDAYKAILNELAQVLYDDKYKWILKKMAEKSGIHFHGSVEFEDVRAVAATEICNKYDSSKELLPYIRNVFKWRAVDLLRREEPHESLDKEDENGKTLAETILTGTKESDPEADVLMIDDWNSLFLKFSAMVLNFSRRTKKGDDTRFQYFEKFYTGDLIAGSLIKKEILLYRNTRELIQAASVPFVNHVDRKGELYSSKRRLVPEDLYEIYLKSEKDASWIPGEGERPVSSLSDPPMKLPMKNGVYRGYFAQVESRVIAPSIISQQLKGYSEQKKEWRRANDNKRREQLIEDNIDFEVLE